MSEEHKGTIKMVLQPKEFKGKMQVGFMLQEHDGFWFNAIGKEEDLKILVNSVLQKGNVISYKMEGDYANSFKLIEKAEPSKERGKWEDDIVSFETLLTAAHNKKQPFSIKTEMITVDLEKKYALFKASVIVKFFSKTDGEHEVIFEGHGDTTSENVSGEFIKPHFIRMAETRAICRALRWYTNNGCAEEEKK